MENERRSNQLARVNRYSRTELALNYYTLYEGAAERENRSECCSHCLGKANRLIGGYLEGRLDADDVSALRTEVIRKVETITSYGDCFRIYEHVLGRMEGRFVKKSNLQESDEAMAELICNCIADSRDEAVRQEMLAVILGELPVRLTKSKFFDIFRDALSQYVGSPKQGFTDMLYIIRTASMVSLPSEMRDDYGEMYEFLEELRGVDYKNLTAKEHKRLTGRMEKAGVALSEEVTMFTVLQDVVNDLYLICLTGGEAKTPGKGERTPDLDVVSRIYGQFESGKFQPPHQETTELLAQLEGVQEELYEKFTQENLPQPIDALISGSPFANLDREENMDTADAEYVAGEIEGLVGDLDRLFSELPKAVTRAVMARLLSELPVFFHSYNELRDYVLGSLKACVDLAEKEACKEELKGYIEWEYALE